MENRNENFETCKRIALELDNVAAGRMFKCPYCGNLVELENNENGFTCPVCGADVSVEGVDPYNLYDYFEDVFDIEYRIGGDLQYRSVQVMIACGGPNIYVDTAAKAVELYWWTEHASYALDYDTVTAIDDIFEEYFNMR